jgi:hypothetical protein
MAITQALCVSFKEDLMSPGANLEANTLKLALYTNAATLNENTATFSATNEVSGTGYSSGGATLTNVAVTTDGNVAIFDCDNVAFANSTITAQAALIYNNSNSNSAICVLDFGGDKSSTNGTFEIQFPTADADNALIRIS